MPEATGTTEGKNFFDLINDGGIPAWMIVAMSFVMVALTIDNIVGIRRERIVPPGTLGEIEELFEKQEYDAAIELCEVERCFLTDVIGSGLANLGSGWEQMDEGMTAAAEQAATRMYQRVGYLNLIGTVAPMIGLFGTVVGIIQAFMVIAQKGGAPKPAELAAGIYMALVCTALGLSVAIPALSLHFVFRGRLTRMLQEGSDVVMQMMKRFRPRA